MDTMTWSDYQLARQYLVESRIGTRIREAKAVEERQAKSATQQLSRNR